MKNLIVLLAAAAVIPITVAHAGPKDEKVIVQNEPPQEEGGFYLSLFGGANLGQSADSKDINVSGAKPIGAGTPAQINSYFLPGSNSGLADAGVQRSYLVPSGVKTHSPTFSSDIASNTGWMSGIRLGYEFRTHSIIKPELEIEGFYNGINTSGSLTSKNKIRGLRTADDDGDEASEPFLNPDAIVAPTKANVNFADQMNAAVFMLNGIIKFDLGRIRPYIGGGVGLAYVTHNFSSQRGEGIPVKSNAQLIQTPNGPVQGLALKNTLTALNNVPSNYFQFGSDSEETFAWQAVAGVEYAITPRVSVFTEYKALFYLDGPYYRDLLQNSVTGGIRYNF